MCSHFLKDLKECQESFYKEIWKQVPALLFANWTTFYQSSLYHIGVESRNEGRTAHLDLHPDEYKTGIFPLPTKRKQPQI